MTDSYNENFSKKTKVAYDFTSKNFNPVCISLSFTEQNSYMQLKILLALTKCRVIDDIPLF